MSVTIYDVAKKAKVSPATVSMVCNSARYFDRVSEKTRAKVQAVIQELGFQPNSRGLIASSRRNMAVGVHLIGGAYSLHASTFYGQMLQGVQSAITEAEYLCVLSRSEMTGTEIPRFLRRRMVDAFIALHRLDPEVYQAALGVRVPVIAVNTDAPRGVQTVNFDDVGAVRQALDRLWAMGHRKIGYVDSGGDINHCSHNIRLNAYCQWMMEHQSPAIVSPPFFLREYQHGPDLWAWVQARLNDAQPVTTLLFHSQNLFTHAMESFAGTGIRIPEKVSVASCEVTSHAAGAAEAFRLSGIEYDVFEAGRVAAGKLLGLLTGGKPIASQVLQGRWFEGNTAKSV